MVPAPSAFSLAAARLGWALPETTLLSLHGRPLDLVRPHLQPGARILALTSDGEGPPALARAAARNRLRRVAAHRAGSARRPARAGARDDAPRISISATIDALNVVALGGRSRARRARILARAAGLPDALFEHDGQITKREIRAVTLSSLAPRQGELLWDIGAGAGSVAIEWMLADPSLRAIADRGARRSRRAHPAQRRGVRRAGTRSGRRLRAGLRCMGLPQPDAIFVGGGAAEPGLLDAAVAALRSGGRLVVNAVTLETEAVLLARHAAQGGELVRIALSRADRVGEKTGWRPAMPVTQWIWIKP